MSENEMITDFEKSGLGIEIRPLEDVPYRATLVITEASGNTLSKADARETAKGIISRYAIVDFLNEVEEQDWELDRDDIRHILNMDFDYIRKQYQETLVTDGISKEKAS